LSAAIALLITSLGPARAAYVVDLRQVADPSQPLGFDVVATGKGTIDLTDLFFDFPVMTFSPAEINPSNATIGGGSTGTVNVDFYSGIIGPPPSFGGGGLIGASSSSGDVVTLFGDGFGELFVPAGYMSGHALSNTSTFDNATFASLGVTPGVYVYNWGSERTLTAPPSTRWCRSPQCGR
jgi:hypothetical protein